MKRNTQIFLITTLILSLALLPVLNLPVNAQWVDPPDDTLPTPIPWNYMPDNGDVVNPPGWVPENIVQQVTERPKFGQEHAALPGGRAGLANFGQHPCGWSGNRQFG